MTEKLKNRIEEEISKLPTIKQQAIGIVNWGKISEEIGKKYLISEEEINNFQLETGLALIGLEGFNQYLFNTENNVGVSKAEAEKIVGEAIQKIFVPISKKIELLIKEKIKTQTPTWQQTINFIVSGDYSSFI